MWKGNSAITKLPSFVASWKLATRNGMRKTKVRMVETVTATGVEEGAAMMIPTAERCLLKSVRANRWKEELFNKELYFHSC